jgi:hypothetical protein
MPCSNLSRDTRYSDLDVFGFPQYLQEKAELVPRLDHGPFVPNNHLSMILPLNDLKSRYGQHREMTHKKEKFVK